ncbi:hypothetical protein ACOI7N_20840 [Pseudomonas sp. P2758]|uniref:hypothetical protein n=1 Tax=Pseudomonas sp. P2758 TaxID=3409916 RepID=UPI003B590983
MSDDRKERALSNWRKLLEEPEMQLDAEGLYFMLLELAESLERDGVITHAEWRRLTREASVILTRTEEGEERGA